jgi:hypothetical protein
MIIECFSVLTYLASYVTALSVLLSEVVPLQVVPIEDLTRSSPSEGLLPEAVSEALGTSLSEVLNLYFGELDEDTRDRLVWDAIDRRRGEEEDIDILREESRRADKAEFRKTTRSSMIEISLNTCGFAMSVWMSISAKVVTGCE